LRERGRDLVEQPGGEEGEPRNEPGKVTGGAFRMNLNSGAVETTDMTFLKTTPSGAVRAGEKPGSNAEGQILSADGKTFVISRQTSDDSVFEKYTLTVYDRRTGTELGQFQSHVAFVPFFVIERRIVFAAAPYVRRTATGLIEKPRSVEMKDLTTGKLMWSFEVRDDIYRGPFPP